MSAVQRWRVVRTQTPSEIELHTVGDDQGEWVKYDDHERALAEAVAAAVDDERVRWLTAVDEAGDRIAAQAAPFVAAARADGGNAALDALWGALDGKGVVMKAGGDEIIRPWVRAGDVKRAIATLRKPVGA